MRGEKQLLIYLCLKTSFLSLLLSCFFCNYSQAQTPLFSDIQVSDNGINNSIGSANTSRNIGIDLNGNIYATPKLLIEQLKDVLYLQSTSGFIGEVFTTSFKGKLTDLPDLAQLAQLLELKLDVSESNKGDWILDFLDSTTLTASFQFPYNLIITAHPDHPNIQGRPTKTITVGGNPYTLGGTIPATTVINHSVSIASVIAYKIEKV